MKPTTCERCLKPTFSTIMSMYNTEEICRACKAEEKQRPDYQLTRDSEEASIKDASNKT